VTRGDVELRKAIARRLIQILDLRVDDLRCLNLLPRDQLLNIGKFRQLSFAIRRNHEILRMVTSDRRVERSAL
jgi:hypothetical protein